jgi:hypothetical protein
VRSRELLREQQQYGEEQMQRSVSAHGSGTSVAGCGNATCLY